MAPTESASSEALAAALAASKLAAALLQVTAKTEAFGKK